MKEPNLPEGWGEVKDPVLRSAIAAWGGQWQSIETAPKDGTEILACWDAPNPDYRARGVIQWHRHDDPSDPNGGMWATLPGFWRKEPTHWMPLPAPPTNK